ncbi:MAG: hypothetical protein QOF41_422 [Methylobacteriaceae bacterium]|nr:hypothetical protein [Methylobacteriaceae bacterium]
MDIGGGRVYPLEIISPYRDGTVIQFNIDVGNNVIYQASSPSYPNDGGMGVDIPIGSLR